MCSQHIDLRGQTSKERIFSSLKTASLAVCLGTVFLSGCITEETSIHGFVPTEYTLDQITEGSSREQVMLTLGSPSTIAHFGNEVFYYISQTRKKPVAFMNSRPVSQTVVAVYFDEEQRVSRTVRYGLKDGQLFDFTNQVTPTGGAESNFLSRLMSNAGPQPDFTK
ncbi:outer membrane protein assembly factor BamE [Cohaesibacter celericrescens]|uniref:Outer membrane assembly protein BamE n=1 Tax=Cohaesibacter celericrescens TaxID=2067669 RepID=A0A2N5XQJ4_9HYPH|nr:outer membrane protein assembly factor BamE [Cohaesibacter celericrescens]PLW76710.1 outer membrane assembly protein BamE [Cohaesibacter celericrescens]